MRLRRLFQVAFEGCDETLESALRSRRYRVLLARAMSQAGQSRKHAEMAALLDLLGERLVVATISCLPYDALRVARAWRTLSPDDQLRAARDLRDMLAPKREPSSSDASDQHTPPLFLPRDVGRLDMTARNPSCLTVGYALAAFAHVAQASYCTLSVQRTVGELAAIGYQQLMVAGEAVISQTLPLVVGSDRLPKLISDRAADPSVFDYDSFHVATATQRSDGTYLEVDPYMGNVALLHGDPWGPELIRKLDRCHEDILWWRQEGAEWPDLSYWLQMLKEIELVVHKAFGLRHVCQDPGALLLLPAMMRDLLAELDHERPQIDRARLLEGYDNHTILYHANRPVDGPDTLCSLEAIIDCLVDLEVGSQAWEIAFQRIILFLLRSWQYQAHLACRKYAAESLHPAVSISHPHRTLAVMTLGNIRHHMYPNRCFRGALLPYHRGEIVWHEATADVRVPGWSRAERRLLAERTIALRAIPPEAVHPLIAKRLGETRSYH